MENLFPLSENSPHVTIVETKLYKGKSTMADKNSYQRLQSSARLTTYVTPEERQWIDDNLIPDGESRTEYLRRLIHEDAIRKGLEPPFAVKRLGNQ